MSVIWQYYLGIGLGTVVVGLYALTKLPMFLVLMLAVWLFYALFAVRTANRSSSEIG
jgi:hypothetical protein